MNQVNFLPESFIRAQARKRRIARQILLGVVVAGLLTAWGGVEQATNLTRSAELSSLEDRVTAARQRQTELVKLQARHGVLLHQVQIQHELAQPVSHTQIIATLGSLLPDTMALTELSLEAHRPKPLRRGMAAAPEAKAAHDYLKIELEGLAPDGASVANLVEAFADHPLFSEVRMRHSRSLELRGVIAREFRLEMKVDLNRRFEAPAPSQEVAYAD